MSVLNITKDTFTQEVINSDIPVLIDFWAPWCGPCRMVGPVIDEIAKEKSGIIKVGKINVDDEPELASKFGVMSIPMLMIFKDGKLASSSVGAKSKQSILNMLDF